MRTERLIIKARKLLVLAVRDQKLVAGKKWFVRAAVENHSFAIYQNQREHMSKAFALTIALFRHQPPNPAFQRTAFGCR